MKSLIVIALIHISIESFGAKLELTVYANHKVTNFTVFDSPRKRITFAQNGRSREAEVSEVNFLYLVKKAEAFGKKDRRQNVDHCPRARLTLIYQPSPKSTRVFSSCSDGVSLLSQELIHMANRLDRLR